MQSERYNLYTVRIAVTLFRSTDNSEGRYRMARPNGGNCPSCGKKNCMVLVKTRQENNGKEIWECNHCRYQVMD